MRVPVRLAALAAIALAACAAPSRRLTPRVVEDPIVLPKRMASVSTEISFVHYEPTDVQGTFGEPGFRFGLTNRLEWFGLIGLRFAILDDRPADGRAPMPFSLAVHAGVMGIGCSSAEGMIVVPVASLTVLKHVADRWALSLAAGWRAQWVERTSLFASRRRTAARSRTPDGADRRSRSAARSRGNSASASRSASARRSPRPTTASTRRAAGCRRAPAARCSSARARGTG